MIELYGLNEHQSELANQLWQIEEWDDVELFISTLSEKDKADAYGIVEMMRMAIVEQSDKYVSHDLSAAAAVIDKVKNP